MSSTHNRGSKLNASCWRMLSATLLCIFLFTFFISVRTRNNATRKAIVGRWVGRASIVVTFRADGTYSEDFPEGGLRISTGLWWPVGRTIYLSEDNPGAIPIVPRVLRSPIPTCRAEYCNDDTLVMWGNSGRSNNLWRYGGGGVAGAGGTTEGSGTGDVGIEKP